MRLKQLLIVFLFASTLPGLAVAAEWHMQAEASRLGFEFAQAGADESGEFKQFSAKFEFAPDDLASSAFDVTIDIASLDTGDAERDEILHSADMFDVKKWPQARFKTLKIQHKSGNDYVADAELTIRDKTQPIVFPFSLRIVAQDGKPHFHLTSTVTIKRLDYGVGHGDWAETTWVSDEVQVLVDVKARQ